MWHIIGECLERSRSMEGWERWFTRSRCEVQENVFERTEEDVFSREANNTYGYMGEGNYASNIKKQGKSHTSGLTKPNMEGIEHEKNVQKTVLRRHLRSDLCASGGNSHRK